MAWWVVVLVAWATLNALVWLALAVVLLIDRVGLLHGDSAEAKTRKTAPTVT